LYFQAFKKETTPGTSEEWVKLSFYEKSPIETSTQASWAGSPPCPFLPDGHLSIRQRFENIKYSLHYKPSAWSHSPDLIGSSNSNSTTLG
jgi:hypothetical protein